MKTTLIFIGACLFGLLFWPCIDAIQAGPAHTPFELTDSRTLYGVSAWVLAYWSCSLFVKWVDRVFDREAA